MSASPSNPPIRVALRFGEERIPAYLAAAADAIIDVPGTEIVLVLVAPSKGQSDLPMHGRPSRLARLYEWLEVRTLRGGPLAVGINADLPRSDGVVVIRSSSVVDQADALRAADPDVLVDLGPADADGQLPIPRSGRWHLQYAVGVGGPRQANLARPRTESELAESLLAIDQAPGVTWETDLGVSTLRRIGYARDRDAVYWRSARLPARRLARLVAGDAVGPASGESPGGSRSASPRQNGPGGPPFLGLFTTVAGKVLERLLYRDKWIVLTRQRRPGQEPPRNLSGFMPVEAPRGRFYADPFVTLTPDGPRLYVEDCPVGTHHGRISTLTAGSDGRWTFERVVLNDIDHRAYPHVTPVEGGLLIALDNGDAGGVDLFLDRGRDLGLERVGQCLEGLRASDPTLLYRDERYWLFVTVTGHGMSPWDELHLFSAMALAGPWQPHPRNPVVADVRRARPGGRIFQSGDIWIRPGQDCSTAYGQRIVLNAITILTPTEYEERPIGTIEPGGGPGVRRTHTYTFDGSTEALDGYHRRLRIVPEPAPRRDRFNTVRPPTDLPNRRSRVVGFLALMIGLVGLIGLIGVGLIGLIGVGLLDS